MSLLTRLQAVPGTTVSNSIERLACSLRQLDTLAERKTRLRLGAFTFLSSMLAVMNKASNSCYDGGPYAKGGPDETTRKGYKREIDRTNEEADAILRTEAAVMNDMTPLRFAVILDRISTLLEEGTSLARTASLATSLRSHSFVTEEVSQEEEGELGMESLSILELEVRHGLEAEVEAEMESLSLVESDVQKEHMKIARGSFSSNEGCSASSLDEVTRVGNSIMAIPERTADLERTAADIIEIAEKVETLQSLQKIIAAENKRGTAEAREGPVAESCDKHGLLRRTLSSWRIPKQSHARGSKCDKGRLIASSFWQKAKNGALLTNRTNADEKYRYRSQFPNVEVSRIDESGSEESEIENDISDLLSARTIASSLYERSSGSGRALSDDGMFCVPIYGRM